MANKSASVEGMVLSREKRQNAGARMADLLNKEDCDDFYQSTYGGFFDEENDDAYESSDSESDYVDSDFDIDETDKAGGEDKDDGDEDYVDDASEQRRKSTKVYKEPTNRPKTTAAATPLSKSTTKSDLSRPAVSTVSKRAAVTPSPVTGKKFRQSTLLKGEEYERRRELVREKRARRKKHRKVSEYYQMPSQAELLLEAKETEEANIKSLERFQQYELEKRKRHRLNKQRLIKGPWIRYVSTTMPNVWRGERGGDGHHNSSSNASLHRSDSDVASSTNHQNSGTRTPQRKFILGGDEQSNSTSGPSTPSVVGGGTGGVESDQHQAESSSVTQRTRRGGATPASSKLAAAKIVEEPVSDKIARTFITFSDDSTFDRFVPKSRRPPPVPMPQICVVTGRSAKYLDPLTKLPYYNVEAFKIIREAYHKHVEEKGDRNDPHVTEWLRAARRTKLSAV